MMPNGAILASGRETPTICGIILMPRKIYPPRDKKVVFGIGLRRDTLK